MSNDLTLQLTVSSRPVVNETENLVCSEQQSSSSALCSGPRTRLMLRRNL